MQGVRILVLSMNPHLLSRLLPAFAVAGILFITAACSSEPNSELRITLPSSQCLSETSAGWWLRELGISKPEPNQDVASRIRNALVYRVRRALEAKGKLHDQYVEGKDTLVREYIIVTQHPIHGLGKQLLIRQKQTGGENSLLWFEIQLPPEGVPWLILLSSYLADDQIPEAQYDRFISTRSRGDKDVVTITSPGEDGARLLLYGPGAYCTQIVLD